MSRYAVTGCAGFIGSHLTEALLDRGQEVVGVDSFTSYYPRERKESNLSSIRDAAGFTLIEDDLSTKPLTALISDVDGVFHLAAQAGVRESWGDGFTAYLRDNLQPNAGSGSSSPPRRRCTGTPSRTQRTRTSVHCRCRRMA
jgi:nucleoside-diphosphate-sugar epimerase